MPEWREIQALCERIVERFHPDQIVLFGSYATGTARPDSDVDLLVIMPYAGPAPYKAIEILDATDPRFPVDLLVRSPEQVAERLALNDFFLRDILEQGKVLYAAADARVGRQG